MFCDFIKYNKTCMSLLKKKKFVEIDTIVVKERNTDVHNEINISKNKINTRFNFIQNYNKVKYYRNKK